MTFYRLYSSLYLLRFWVGLVLLVGLSGCSTLEHYMQLAQGHMQLMHAREPIAPLLEDKKRDPQLRQRLAQALAARTFGSAQLGLPDNQSYRVYADIQRPFVVWNVFVTPEFSLRPENACFPVAGCVAYRGFYQLGRARGAAALAAQEGLDAWVAGVDAYSTLGWFDDPILSSMLRRDDQQLAALIFHEMAHQQLYVADDTAFNESFASFVEREGLRQWLHSQGLPAAEPHHLCQRQAFVTLVLRTRERLQVLYSSRRPEAEMRQAKKAEFDRLTAEYWQLRAGPWLRMASYDGWFSGPLNNAKLLPFGLYEQWQPAFAELFHQSNGDWALFYARAQALAELSPELREQGLQILLRQAGAEDMSVCAVTAG